MWVAASMKRTMAILLGMTGLMVVLIGGPVMAPSADGDWFNAMMNAVLVEQLNQGPFWGAYAPYVAQLEEVRAHFRRGNIEATYAGMNHFMDMLEQRENGIPEASADRLFDYCYAVTPASYHDVSRHIERVKEHRFGGRIRPVG